MAPRKRSSLERLFGSATRTRVLGLLAASRDPMTGYEISKALRIVPAKVYGVLRDMEFAGFVQSVPGRPGSKRYRLVDEDLRGLLSHKARIATARDWFSPEKVREREDVIERAKHIRVSAPTGRPRPSDLPNYREFIRAREKDLVVEKVVARRRRSS